MTRCRLCQTATVVELLDAGAHPVSNRFLADRGTEERSYPLALGQCSTCGLVQLIDPVPAAEVVAPYDWITYNEPEGHLDQLVDVISTLPGITSEAVICGLSFKEDSTLARFQRRGFSHTWRIDPATDLGITDPRAGIESIQERLDPGRSEALRQEHGASDVVIARHIVEHTHDTLRFMNAVRALVRPGGYVVFEVPDCTRVLETLDYTTIWEEHILYFTSETFRRCFGCAGYTLTRFEVYPYPYENSLVAIVQPGEGRAPDIPSDEVLHAEHRRARAFAEGLPGRRLALRQSLLAYQRDRGKVALFGAGHLACMFIGLMGLEDAFEFVVDDHPHKQGLFMPGSRLPIRGSGALLTDDVKLCLTSLSPESEDKVVEKNQAFLDRGGQFASIFPASKRALQL